MAFTVEDGSIIASSNSYVNIAYADAYHSDRSNTLWVGDETAKQAALIKATDYIEHKYNNRFKGELVDAYQALSFPRYDVQGVLGNEIPTSLKDAVCLLALEALSTDLCPNTETGAIKREKTDIVETEYFEGASVGITRPAISGLLRGLLKNRRCVKVVRV
ncbi:MAG: DnaT-like ssDNA-binding protein [Alphaproteobacteria bacterium]